MTKKKPAIKPISAKIQAGVYDSYALPADWIALALHPLVEPAVEYLLKNFDSCIAGGFAAHTFARGLDKVIHFGDLDFFFRTTEEKNKALEYVTKILKSPDVSESDYMGDSVRAHTFNIQNQIIQLIKMIEGTAVSVMDTFDFENAKAAITWDRTTNQYILTHSKVLKELVEKEQVMFRQQMFLVAEEAGMLSTLPEKQKFAKSNFDRLEKYLVKYNKGFFDEESRTQILLQYAWDLKYLPRSLSNNVSYEEIGKLLRDPKTSLEDLILFYPLGGFYKKLFDFRSKPDYSTSSAIAMQIHEDGIYTF